MISNSNHATMNDNLRRTMKGQVELYNGSTLLKTFLSTDRLQEITVVRTGEKGKFFGFGICQQATVKLLDKNKTLSFFKGNHLRTSFNANETSPLLVCPKFFIKEAQRDENTNTFTITAYDALDSATAHTWSELGMVAPYTLTDVVGRITSVLGLGTSGYEALPTGFDLSYPNGANFGGEETLRQVLNAIAEVTQTVYFINHANRLKFIRPSKSAAVDLTIYKKDYFELSIGLPTTLTKIMHVTELGDNIHAGTDDGACQYIRDNPFWNNRTDLGTLIPEALNRVSGLTMTPYSCKWRGNYLTEIADKIAIEDDDGTINTFIFDDTFSYTGGFTQTCNWEYNPDSDKATASNPATLGEKLNQTFAKVDKIEKNITLYVGDIVNEVLPGKIDEAISEVLGEGFEDIEQDIAGLKATTETHTENISQLQLTSTSINGEVSALKETTTVLRNDLGEVVATQETIQDDVASLRLTSNTITASVSSVEQKVTNLNTEIGNVSNQANSRIDTLASDVALKLDKQGVEITVDRRLEEGVDKVVTSSKKYTFDDTGLNVSSSGSEISTRVTEDGMQISKSAQEVLTVNNQGVKAQNLHAYTFLIIGENSRMEDRGNRTACFWIGQAGG